MASQATFTEEDSRGQLEVIVRLQQRTGFRCKQMNRLLENGAGKFDWISFALKHFA
jgi:hypothetical protein